VSEVSSTGVAWVLPLATGEARVRSLPPRVIFHFRPSVFPGYFPGVFSP
jgi:hypothetical protein